MVEEGKMRMEISKKRLISLIFLCMVFSASITYAYDLKIAQHKTPQVKFNVFVFHESASGIEQISAGNVITNIGEQYVRNLVGFDNATANNATKWISLSNDASPAVTWTKLANEITTAGFGRAEATGAGWTYSGDFSYNYTKKFTATGAITAQCAGLQWSPSASSDNNLFACAAFTQTTFAANDNCTIVWMIVIDAN